MDKKIIIRKRAPKFLVITDDTKEVVLHTTKPRLITVKCINLKFPDRLNDRYMNVTQNHKVLLV